MAIYIPQRYYACPIAPPSQRRYEVVALMFRVSDYLK